MGRVWSHQVFVQKAAERHHEAKPKSEVCGDQKGADGEGHPGQARLQGQVCCARVTVDKGHIRTGAPTGSTDAFFITLAAAAKVGLDYNGFDAQSAYLQPDGIERLLLLRMPHKNQPLATKPGQVFVATGSMCGTWDAGHAWYDHSKKVLDAAGFVGSRQGQGLYHLH